VIEKAKTDSPRPEEEMDKALKDLIGKNLLINPGAEEGLRGWAANTRSYGTRRNDPHPAHGGSWYFFPGAYKGVAVLSQVVDLKPFVTLINKRILGYTVRVTCGTT
jgi:hypothetical protein